MASASHLRVVYSSPETIQPRHYFDVSDGTLIRDEIGRQIDTPLAIRREALRIVTALAAEEADDAKDCSLRLTVRDDSGVARLAIRLVCQVEEL